MNQIEIKNWLEWVINTLSNEAASNIILDTQVKPDLVMYWHGLQVAQIEPNEEVYEVLPLMQLAIQEEIAKQGWFFHLRTHKRPEVMIKRCNRDDETDFICIAAERANTILEAMMLAFREAWVNA